MRIPLLATLSGRIVLGFAVLLMAFGTISAVIVFNMGLLSDEIRLIRTGYIPLALETKNLDEKQDILWSYLSNELEAETNRDNVGKRLIRHWDARWRSLLEIEETLDNLTDIPNAHRRNINGTREAVAELRADIESQRARYDELRSNPPVVPSRTAPVRKPDDSGRAPVPADDRAAPSRIADADMARSRAVLKELKAAESRILSRVRPLASRQSARAERIAQSLEDNGDRLRTFSIYLGVAAVLFGVLIMVWATVTLRPLRRLRDAARRIAQGEYESRIDEKGPTEVADLAREFNVMGRAVEEREQARVRHERLAAVGKMAAMIVHEVRNPLSAIGLNTELLEEELSELSELPDAVEASELCRAITTEVDRLTAITEQYLQVARLPKPKLQTQQLNPLVSALAEFQREQMALRGVTLTLQLADQLTPVQIDETQMRQAVLNLLRNATEATLEAGGGEVALSSHQRTTESGSVVELCVRDQGPGIAEELAGKLFEPFFSTKDGGTGLGLALTHQIIREHGGDLHVDSEPGHGATFTISLPGAMGELADQ